LAEAGVRDDRNVSATLARDESCLLVASATAADLVCVEPPGGPAGARQTFVVEGVERLVEALLAA